jgi:hypothetical protein
MTRMLYTACIMNNKPNIPGEIFLGEKEYSWRADWKVNGWLFVATLISCFSDIIFHHAVWQWPLGYRVCIVLAQFLAILLWARSLTRWIRGMDELHRRITTSAVLFAISATFLSPCFGIVWTRRVCSNFFFRPANTPMPVGIFAQSAIYFCC